MLMNKAIDGVSTFMPEKRFDVKLIDLLKSNPNFVGVTGELRRENIKNRAWDFDRELVNLLLSDETIASHFFDEVSEGRFIFNSKKFIVYLNNMNFLAKSYTQFRNKIRLTIDGKFLQERGEVALAFPYKDCVLEGGQTAEDEKRNEVFFNEILARDEISRMLDPKVLTHWKRHTATGEEEVTEIKRDKKGVIRENLIIKGNNLIALHTLKRHFRGQVKLIYIDPPYNTGNDSFGYNNNFNHSTWLTFMKNRLEVSKELLNKEGVIFVQCDDNEQAYLKVLMDEVFGSQSFLSNSAVVINRGGRDYGSVARTHEYLLIYSKNPETELNQIEDLTKKLPYEDDSGKFKLVELRNRNILFNDQTSPTLCYPFYVNPDNEDENGLLEVSLKSQSGFIEVMPQKSQGVQTVWRWGKEKAHKSLNKDIKGKAKQGGGYMIIQKDRKTTKRQRSVWDEKEFVNQRGTDHIKDLFNSKAFAYPKSEHLIQRIIELGSSFGDIVLDFHVGSGTTATAAHKMGRQYIGIEQMDYITKVTVPRIKKVIAGEQGGISKSVDWQGGGDLIYCELKSNNQTFLDRIQSTTESDTLLDIWREMCTGASVLKWYLNTENIEAAEKAFIAINDIEQQKMALVELLDKTHLYVHYSEMEDENADVNDNDKKLNHSFYEGGTDAEF